MVEAFTEAIGLARYAIYVFDYGAPVGFRLALSRPERVTAIVSQNGNAYEEGLSTGWNPIQAYWRDPSAANREALRSMLTLEATKWQYVHGVADEAQRRARVVHARRRPAGAARQRRDPARPVPRLREQRGALSEVPAVLPRRIGRRCSRCGASNDPFFLPAGAEAFARDNPNARVQLLDTGHFALETHAQEIADAIRHFLDEAIAG